jgi:hypothetical protein
MKRRHRHHHHHRLLDPQGSLPWNQRQESRTKIGINTCNVQLFKSLCWGEICISLFLPMLKTNYPVPVVIIFNKFLTLSVTGSFSVLVAGKQLLFTNFQNLVKWGKKILIKFVSGFQISNTKVLSGTPIGYFALRALSWQIQRLLNTHCKASAFSS